MIPFNLALEKPSTECCDLDALECLGPEGQGLDGSGPASALWSLTIPSTHEVSAYSWTVSLYAGADVVFEKDNAGAVTKYVLADGMRLAKITPSGAVQYYLADHEGSTRQVRDANRNLVFSTEYEPFGKPYAVTGSEAYKYTSERHDDPTGLVYLRARQYDPDLGRFTSADPVLGSLSAPQTQNRFTYTVNNPLRYTDPSGMSSCNPNAGEQFFQACERWAAWDASVSDVQAYYLAHPFQLGPWETLDFLMMFGSFLPLFDTLSDAWFIGRDVQTCLAGTCDWGQLGLDVGFAALPLASIGLVRLSRMASHAQDVARWANRGDEVTDLPQLLRRVDLENLPQGATVPSRRLPEILRAWVGADGKFMHAGKGWRYVGELGDEVRQVRMHPVAHGNLRNPHWVLEQYVRGERTLGIHFYLA